MRRAILAGAVLAGLLTAGAPPASADSQQDQIQMTSVDVSTEDGYVVDGCKYNYKYTMIGYDIFHWWLFTYTGVASWCYDGFGVTSKTFSTTWTGRWGWEMTGQSTSVTHSGGSENGHYFWWQRVGTGHFKNCQYGICDTGDLMVSQKVFGNGAIQQSGG